MSVDGTDFRIYDPWPFDSKWYSRTFHGPGLRYEIGICIATWHIVWANGPFPFGAYPDVKIFQLSMKLSLEANEEVVADGAYNDERCSKMGENSSQTRFYGFVRTRHETVNQRFKQFLSWDTALDINVLLIMLVFRLSVT